MTVDLFTLPHKALRQALGDAGTHLAAHADPGLAVVALDDLEAHGHHEDELILPVLRRLLPALAAEQEAQHLALTARVGAVRRHLDAVRGPEDALAAYRALQRLAAANLAHLDHEEVVVMPALATAAPEGTTEEVMARFRAAHPDAGALYRRWPAALTAAERELVGA